MGLRWPHATGLIGQPAEMREVCGRIMLGPSLLGFVAPDLYTRFLPPSLGAFPVVYAQLGVIRYLFLVGLDLDLGVLRESGVLLVLCVVGALVQRMIPRIDRSENLTRTSPQLTPVASRRAAIRGTRAHPVYIVSPRHLRERYVTRHMSPHRRYDGRKRRVA